MYAKIGGIGRNTGNGFEGKEIKVHHMDDLSNRDFRSWGTYGRESGTHSLWDGRNLKGPFLYNAGLRLK